MKVVLALTLLIASVATTSAQYLGMSGTGSNPNSHYVHPHVNSNGRGTTRPIQTAHSSTTTAPAGIWILTQGRWVLAGRCV